MKGMFITFEGTEGSGKSTHALRLAARLREEGYEVVPTREPGGTPTGEAIRDILQHDSAGELLFPETEVMLFAASRAQLVRRVIRPALERGACVVSDRFADSTAAYQGYGRGVDVEMIVAMNALAVGGVVPDLTILLDIDVALGFQRIRERNHRTGQADDRFEREGTVFHQRVREGYLRLARRWPDRIRLLDSRGDPDGVAEEAWRMVAPVLRKREAGA